MKIAKGTSKIDRITIYVLAGIVYYCLINIYPIGITTIKSFNTQRLRKIGLFVNNEPGHKFY